MKKLEIDPQLFIDNRKRFIDKMEAGSLAVFQSNDEFPRNGDQNFPFRQNSDLFYLTGIVQENTILLLFPECPDKNLQEVLFVRRTDDKIARWEGHKYSKEEAKHVSGIEKIRWSDEFSAVLTEVMTYVDNVYLNTVEYFKYSNEVPYRDLRFAREIRERYPNHGYLRAAPVMASLRMIKSPAEIDLIKHAVSITGKAFRRVLAFARPGVAEYEVEAEIGHEFTINRANGHAYQPIIASGSNACVLHYTDNDAVCADGDLLLMDFGAEYANYAADLTRTIPVNGKFTDRQRACYEAVLDVQREAIKMLVPGNTPDQVSKDTYKLMEQKMIGLGLLKEEDIAGQDPDAPLYMKYFMHGTSHFLGLDVHDVGSKFEAIKPGMVFTCEPGLYIPAEGIGIRLENNILVTEGQPVDLTADIPVEPDEIEALMKKNS